MMDKSIEKTINNLMNVGGTEYSWIPLKWLKLILFSSSVVPGEMLCFGREIVVDIFIVLRMV